MVQMGEPFAVITFPKYPGTITKHGLGRPAVAFYGLTESAPVLSPAYKWWNEWLTVTVNDEWCLWHAPKVKKGGKHGSGDTSTVLDR